MRINPEIRRNIWLEFSLHRAIAMPLVLGIIFYITSQIYSGIPPKSLLGSASILIFFLLVKLWGGHKAADSVIDEVNDNTWDFQKLSALSPWSLALGKLFGGTVYAWYGGLIAFAVTVIASLPQAPLYNVCVGAVLLLLSGLVVHAAALFSSLLAIQGKTGSHNKLRSLPYLLIGLVAGNIFSSTSILNWWIDSHFATSSYNGGIIWYGTSYDRLSFYAVTSAIMLAWLIVGIYWQMRGQMKLRTGPWLWLGFVLFLILFISGVDLLPAAIQVSSALQFRDLLAFITGFICLYVIVFQEAWNIVRYRRMRTAFQEMDYFRAIEICPRWIPTFFICLITVLAMTIWEANPGESAFMFAWLCFAVRDIAILHFFKLFPASRRPFQTTKFYLAVLYVLMPFLLNAFHAHDLVALFVPWPFDGNKAYIYQGLASGLVQAVIAVLLALWRWQQYGRRAV